MISRVEVQCDHCKCVGEKRGAQLAQLPPRWFEISFLLRRPENGTIEHAWRHACPDHAPEVIAAVLKERAGESCDVSTRSWRE